MKKLFTFLTFLPLCYMASAQLNCDNTLICDGLDGYVTGALGPQADHWTTWSGDEGGAEDGIVSTDYAFSGNNSMQITGQNGPQDVLLLLGNKTSGNFRIDFKMFIFDGQRGYFNLQKDEVPAVQWGQEVYFTEDGTGSIDAGGSNAAQFTFPYDEWFNITQFIDLDNDRTSLFIAGQAVHSWQFSLSAQATSTPINQIGAVDFFAINEGNHLFYIDDVRYTELPANNSPKRMVQFNVDLSLESSVAAEGAFIAGSFNDWTPEPLDNNGEGNWEGYAAVDDGTEYQYKFLNGAAWENAKPECGVDDGTGGYNRSVAVDTADLVLETVCMNHCVACSEVSSSKYRTLDAEISLFPNPASGEVVVNYQIDTPTDLRLQLVNLMGQTILEMEFASATTGGERLDLEGITSGIYFLQLHDGHRQVSQKLIVE